MNREERQGDRARQSRRGFLRRSVGAALAAGLAQPARLMSQVISAASTLKDDSHDALARVVRVTSDRVMPLRVVHRNILTDALNEGLRLLTGKSRIADAWHALLDPRDVILLKFNQSAAERIGTTQAAAEVLVESLVKAGWNPNQLMLLEAGDMTGDLLRQTRRPDRRWQGTLVNFGESGSDSFIAALDEATAIINVPFLKTHHLATMTSCMKNLSHGLIRRPARFHANGCDPAIAEIVRSPQIRDKLRLNIVNALRVIAHTGSKADGEVVETAGTILLGTNPVASDAVGFGLLNEVRSLRSFPPLLKNASLPRQIVTAERLGLGTADLERIEMPLVKL